MNYRLNLIILALGISAMTMAQADSLGKPKQVKLYSKKGVYILPQKGDIALGIDANPFLYYLGGMFSWSGASAPSFNYANAFGNHAGIFAKYMIADNLALRANFRGDFSSLTDVYSVPESSLAPDPFAPTYVDDQVTYLNNNVHIGFGIEKMRGSSRVVGKYGADVVFGYIKYNVSYNYGNSITNAVNLPRTFNDAAVYSGSMRIINDYVDKGMFIGLRGFLGAEFFIGPKISIGGEFGYAFVYGWSQNRITEYQYWNSSAQEVSTMVRETNDSGYDDFSVGIDNLDGSISIFFYF